MSMVRDPLFHVADPAHNRIPPAGSAIWYRLRDASPTGIAGLPSLVKTVVGSVSASEYADSTLYQLPDDNGNPLGEGGVSPRYVQFIAEDDEDDLFLDQVLTLVGMQVGEQIIVGVDVAYVEQASTTGMLWGFGRTSTHSHIGFGITSGELPLFAWRPKGDPSTNHSQNLTLMSGSSFAAFKGQGRFAVVTSIVPASATTVDVEMRIGNGTLTGVYSYAGIDIRTGGTENPGVSGGVSMSNFGGLAIGSLLGASAATQFWGRGATNVGRIDQLVAARRAYSASRTADVLAQMTTTHRLDFPPALLL